MAAGRRRPRYTTPGSCYGYPQREPGAISAVEKSSPTELNTENGKAGPEKRAGRYLWLAVRTVIRVVTMAHDGQVGMWECVLLTSGAAPLTAAGPLRWVASLGGYRLVGSHLPA